MTKVTSSVFVNFERLSDDEVVLRFATEEDYPFVHTLVTAPSTIAASNDSETSAETTLRKIWDEGLRAPDLRHFVASSQRLGCLAYFRLLYPYAFDKSVWLSFLAVVPEQQGKGYGGRIMKMLLDEARRNPEIIKFGMHTHASNTRALKLYQSLGFQCIKREPWRNKDGTDGERLTLIQDVK